MVNKIDENQVGLFDEVDTATDNRIEIVKSKYLGVEKTDASALFSGFDSLRSITFSSGIHFMSSILKNFSNAEVIFGCRDIVSKGVAAAMAVQATEIEEITRDKNARYLAERVDDGSLKLYVSNETKSHEKIYLLESAGGKKRVITGSANFSGNAFGGIQRENINVYDDDEDAFEYYLCQFEKYRDECASDISQGVLEACLENEDYLKENLGEIPIVRKIEKGEFIYLSNDDNAEDVQFVQSVEGFESEIKPFLPKDKVEYGKILVANTVEFKRFRHKQKDESERKTIEKKKLAKLTMDYDTGILTFAGKPLDMHPSSESITNDIERIKSYMDSLSSFTGNIEETREEYFKYLNWYFLSLFNPYLRKTAYASGYDVYLFPVYGVIYGDSNGGKTTFGELASKLMCGKRIDPAKSDDFTATAIAERKLANEGLPINVEDLAKSQYTNNFEKIIKDDLWGIKEGYVNYPSVSISTNKVPSLTSDISKRVVSCHINALIGKTEGVKLKKKVSDNIKKATNALYCEYVSRMYPLVVEMGEKMKSGDNDYFPDAFELSSNVLRELFIEHLGGNVPTYVKIFNHSSYFGDEAVGYNAKRAIIRAWQSEPDSFKVDKRRNELVYSFPEGSNVYQLKYLKDELPPRLGCVLAGKTLTMNYEESKEFFGLQFKVGWFGKRK